MRLWNRVDRAIFKDVSGSFMLGFFGFIFFLLLHALWQLIRDTVEKEVPIALMVGFLIAGLPRILQLAAPMGALVAILVGVGRLNTSSELIALRSVGISPLRLFRPIAILAVLVSLGSLYCGHFLVPEGRIKETELVKELLRRQDLNREISSGMFYDRIPGITTAVLYAKDSAESAQGRLFKGVFLYRDSEDAKTADILIAKRGRAVFDPLTAQASLLLDEGEWHITQPQNPEDYRVIRFQQCTLSFPPDQTFKAQMGDVGEDARLMDGFELLHFIDRLRREIPTATTEADRETKRRMVTFAGTLFHERTALSFASLVLVFAAFPLAARSRRGGKMVGFSQTIGIFFAYWQLLQFGQRFVQNGKISPWLGGWLANITVGLWALVLWRILRRAERGGQRSLGTVISETVSRIRQRFSPRASAGIDSEERPIYQPIIAKKLDFFLGTGFLRSFLMLFIVLLILGQAIAFRQALELVSPNTKVFPWGEVFTFQALQLAALLRYVLPVAVLFGAGISLAGLSRNGELTALKASGVGPFRIALPILVLAATFSGLYAVVQETFLPSAQREIQRTTDRLKGRVREAGLLENTGRRRWVAGTNGRLWHYMDWDTEQKRMLQPGVIEVDFENGRILRRVEAYETRFGSEGWAFSQSWQRVFAASGAEQTYEKKDLIDEPFSEKPALFGSARQALLGSSLEEQMNLKDLGGNIDYMAQAGYPSTIKKLKVGWHEKLATPLLPFLLALAGIPLLVSGWQRKASLVGFSISLALLIVFYGLWATTTGFGRDGLLPPAVAVWLPVATLGVGGIILLARAR